MWRRDAAMTAAGTVALRFDRPMLNRLPVELSHNGKAHRASNPNRLISIDTSLVADVQ